MGKKGVNSDTPSDFFSLSSLDTAEFSQLIKSKGFGSSYVKSKKNSNSQTVGSERSQHISLDSVPATIYPTPTVAPASPAPVANPNPMLCCPTMLGFGWNPMNGGFALNYNRCPPKPKKITVIRNKGPRPGYCPSPYPACTPSCQPYCCPAPCSYPSYQQPCYPSFNPQPTVVIDPNTQSGNKTNYTFFRQTQLAPDLSPEMSSMINRVLQAVAFDQNQDTPPTKLLEGSKDRHGHHHEEDLADPSKSQLTSDEAFPGHHHHDHKRRISHRSSKEKSEGHSRNKEKDGHRRTLSPPRNKEKDGRIRSPPPNKGKDLLRTRSTSHAEEASADIVLPGSTGDSKSKGTKETEQKWHTKIFDYVKDVYREPVKGNQVNKEEKRDEERRRAKVEAYLQKKYTEDQKDYDKKGPKSEDDKQDFKGKSSSTKKSDGSSKNREKIKEIERLIKLVSADKSRKQSPVGRRKSVEQSPKQSSGNRRKSEETRKRSTENRRKPDQATS